MIQYNALGAGMAQLVEQLIRNQQVAGSSPATSSKKSKSTDLDFFIHCEGNDDNNKGECQWNSQTLR